VRIFLNLPTDDTCNFAKEVFNRAKVMNIAIEGGVSRWYEFKDRKLVAVRKREAEKETDKKVLWEGSSWKEIEKIIV
jgi:hypothetical protein